MRRSRVMLWGALERRRPAAGLVGHPGENAVPVFLASAMSLLLRLLERVDRSGSDGGDDTVIATTIRSSIA
jgi:hypothetical protein